MKFIDQVAQHLLAHEKALHELTVVLPSDRATRYLANSLFEQHGGALLSPEIVTIDQWIQKLVNKPTIHPTRALLTLFEAYKKTAQGQDADFESFLTWGPILLADFDDVDRYLVDYRQLFQNLASIKALESWQIDESTYSESQRKFIEFWELIPPLHELFIQGLEKQGRVTKAQAFRMVALLPDRYIAENQFVVFAGFNALSKAEQELIRKLVATKKAEYLIDADRYYLDETYHEAGHFLRQNLTVFGQKNPLYLKDVLRQKSIQIEVVECAQHIGQVNVMSTELSTNPPRNLDETLVLLADESLIHAAVRNLPKTIGKANISLGLPLDQTPVRTWIDLLFQFQENKQKFKSTAIYHKDLQRFIHHAFISASLPFEELQQLSLVERKTVQYNRVFQDIKTLEIGPKAKQILTLIGTDWNKNWLQAIQTIRQINTCLLEVLDGKYELERTAILSFEQSARQFEVLLEEGIPFMQLSSFKRLFYQHWTKAHLAYHGHPTEGLQLMGLLETRLLDFETIYVLGLNEGKMPKNNPIQTLIPMDLRNAFGLPNNRDKQGLFAHHFYRLLHHASRVVITHTTASEQMGAAEPSRYLLQLKMEWQQRNPNVEWKESFFRIPMPVTEQSSGLKIEKTATIIERCKQYLGGAVSASALKKYMDCPLDFYYRYVVEFGEEKEVEEELEHHTFGTMIHSTLEQLFLPFVQRDATGAQKDPAPAAVTAADIAKMLQQYPSILRHEFLNYFDQNEKLFQSGKNRLSFEMALTLTGNLLERELAFVKSLKEALYIERLEAPMKASMTLETEDGPIEVQFKGVIDRIDRIGNAHYRVIDYKSGKVEAKNVKVQKPKEGELKALKGAKHALQLSLYARFFKESYGHFPAEAQIVSLINSDVPFCLNLAGEKDMPALNELFEKGLHELVAEMLNPQLPFEHAPSANYCNYCT
ncbi:MAG: hypothetical protein RLZZ301_764 [Bacteroidota bacterium]|jgi:RecB family exonuclease